MEKVDDIRKKYSMFAAIALLLIAQIALALASERWILLVPLMFIAVLQPFLFPKITIELSRMAQLVLTLPIAILIQVWPLDNPGFGFDTTFFVSLYLIMISVLQLYSKKVTNKSARVILAASIGILFVGNAITNEMIYMLFALIFSIVLFVVLRLSLDVRKLSKRYNSVHIAMLLTAFTFTALVSFGFVSFIKAYYSDINKWFYSVSRYVKLQSAPGFSGEARLGSISDTRDGDQAKQVALRVFSEKEPGYLKGMVFTDYKDAKWHKTDVIDRVKPYRGEDDKQRLGRVVLVGQTAPGFEDKPEFNIFPAYRYGANYFLPLNASAFDTLNKSVLKQPGNIFISEHKRTSRGYQVYISNNKIRYEGESKIYSKPCSDLLVTGALRLTIAKLNIRNNSIEEKVAAVRRYFSANYKYKVGIDFIPKVDPIIQFLTTKNHGHCELFATAGTLMLREMGIRARYVTGFVCSEKVSYGNLWLARNLNAHAWTEYYHPQKGWQTAEFTPASGVPADMVENDSYYEYLYSLWIRLKGFGIGGLFDLLLTYVGQFGQWLIGAWWRIVGLIIFSVWYFIRRNRKASNDKNLLYREHDFSEEIKSAREKFYDLQKELKKHGLEKGEAETLNEYAQRVNASNYEDRVAAAEFIRYFAGIRYE